MSYECSPYRGSEWAVGWGRLLQAAREFETHVITSENNFKALERAQSEGLIPANVRFYTPEPDTRLRRMERKPKLFDYNYTAYHHWQKLAVALARALHKREQFALVHQVNVCTFREPGYAWQLGIPFLWGPMGGSQNLPWRFLPMLPMKEAAKELVRGCLNELSLRLKPRVRAAARSAAMVVGANSTNQRDYRKVFGRDVELLLETGLARVEEPDRSRFEARAAATREGRVQEPLKILWSGQLQTRKALPVLLRALARAQDAAWELLVLGDGPMESRWKAEAQAIGIGDRVEFLGRLPFPDAVAQMSRAELFCFTSLRDTSGNVVLEALAAGVPVICFNHQGAGDMVSDTSGIRIAARYPKQAILDLAEEIRYIAEDGKALLELSQGATEQARKFLWDRNGDWVNAAYRKIASAPKVGESHARTSETIEV